MSQNANFETLGLSSDASWEEVKAAFRRMARLYHPDVAGPDGAQKFTEITEAYMILKETISPGVPGRAAPEAPQRESAGRRFLKSFKAVMEAIRDGIGSIFSRRAADEDYEAELESEIPPARVRFIGSVISRAESDIYSLLSRKIAVKERSTNEAILRRLRSRHPGVVILALRRISSGDQSEEIRRVVLDHFRRNVPTSEVLECLLSLFQSQRSSEDLAQVMVQHVAGFSSTDVVMILSWLKRRRMPVEYFTAFLSHPSDAAIASVLNSWPQNGSLPETAEVFNLLRKDDDAILVPLLRLLKRERVPVWMMSVITRLSRENKSPAVRVWASAIVREQNTS
ncbi:MAG: DnaJ domain-containing protein [Synergistaceae bacterium]|jgi:hypothetical protein|nr:DnaJ domain-containing protein [Synergistaceae bacterium]